MTVQMISAIAHAFVKSISILSIESTQGNHYMLRFNQTET